MINILLFAELQEEAGVNEINVEKAGVTVSALKDWLIKEFKLTSLNDTMMIAINESYANESDVLKDGDTVAFIPPVSGG
ncbi:molybdopterin converting factor subunit 1 [Halalkalibacter krulwichiae]|uniref:Molybdopterin synthase sulfur carrier subunit n=1 Tax=Halalkalibacter krulwichiae TaxID=199441 RepID=A0A1X9MF58_9BACI|nr:molybdopterin converting factor subunit 1 [Halalkalibacter krulwichiae]ARK29082.1 Molybdopterin synthase sulfur carrier subunit [Halalkalibacter krulwichiae]